MEQRRLSAPRPAAAGKRTQGSDDEGRAAKEVIPEAPAAAAPPSEGLSDFVDGPYNAAADEWESQAAALQSATEPERTAERMAETARRHRMANLEERRPDFANTPFRGAEPDERSALSEDRQRPERWSVWLDRTNGSKLRHKPVTLVRPNTRYLVALQLSPDTPLEPGLSQTAPSKPVAELFRRQGADASLTVTVVPDPVSFEFVTRSAPLVIEEIEGPDGKAFYGTAALPVRTRANATGPTSLALVVWSDEAPIDELIVRLCISEAASSSSACRPPAIDDTSVDPIYGSPVPALSPQAALHFVELPERGLMGLFRSGAGKPLGWRLGRSAASLKLAVRRLVLQPLRDAVVKESDVHLRMAARSLRNLVFPPGREAIWRRFEVLLQAARASVRTGVPRLHVRASRLDDDAPMLVPMGIMAMHAKGNELQMVGEHFEVETPLAVRSRMTPTCPGRWVVVAPTDADSELNAATQEAALRPWQTPSTTRLADIDEVLAWFDDKAVQPSTALLVISHHHEGRIWFGDDERQLQLEELTSTFAAPSILVLNACGSAEIGGAGAFDAMNKRGITAGIATLTEVNGRMAGAFLECLGDQLVDATAPTSLGDAHFGAVQCLGKKTSAENKPYGLRALTYVSLGNTHTTLCKPQAELP